MTVDDNEGMPATSTEVPWWIRFLNLKLFFLGCAATFVIYVVLLVEKDMMLSYNNSRFVDYLLTANDSDETYNYGALESAEGRLSEVEMKELTAHMSGEFNNMNVFYREARPPENVQTVAPIVLLHGINSNMDGTSDVWLQRSTMQIFAAAGYRVVAPDLPGTPMSRTAQTTLPLSKTAQFLLEFCKLVGIDQAVIFGASWGGNFALPYLFDYGTDKILALVAVAPVGTERYSKKDYEDVKVPVMLIHGVLDYRLGHNAYARMAPIPNLRHVVVPKAGHAVFQERPFPFHAACLRFLQNVMADIHSSVHMYTVRPQE